MRFLRNFWTLVSPITVAWFISASSVALGEGKHSAVVEFSKDKPFPTDGSLATTRYQPTELEKPYYKRLSDDGLWTILDAPEERKSIERTTKFDFHLQGHSGEFVAWSGIVRGIQKETTGTTLSIENKYAGDMTDSHIETVSINGGGDFKTELAAAPKDLLPLVLVRVYGTVISEENGLPKIRADYIRVWHWFQFNFMSYGEDHGNPEWKERTHFDEDDAIYHSGTFSDLSPKYYSDRLGPTHSEYETIKNFHQARDSNFRPTPTPSPIRMASRKAIARALKRPCPNSTPLSVFEKQLVGTWSMPSVTSTSYDEDGTPHTTVSDEVVEITFTTDRKEFWSEHGQPECVACWRVEGDNLVFTIMAGPEGTDLKTPRKERIARITADEIVFTDGTVEGRWKRVRKSE